MALFELRLHLSLIGCLLPGVRRRDDDDIPATRTLSFGRAAFDVGVVLLLGGFARDAAGGTRSRCRCAGGKVRRSTASSHATSRSSALTQQKVDVRRRRPAFAYCAGDWGIVLQCDYFVMM